MIVAASAPTLDLGVAGREEKKREEREREQEKRGENEMRRGEERKIT